MGKILKKDNKAQQCIANTAISMGIGNKGKTNQCEVETSMESARNKPQSTEPCGSYEKYQKMMKKHRFWG